MTLRLYNTLTRTKEDFAPLDPQNVRMYVCGPTVYDFAHIGNARPVIVFDVLFRLLRHIYGEVHVTYVRNITDIDDKINARAAERRISIRDLTDETYQYYRDDVAALGCLPPTHEPRATDHIDEMREIVELLIAPEHAYVSNEHVLFNVKSMPEYGQLSGRSLDEMIAGARVEVDPHKKNPMDFVLWKPSNQREVNYPLPAWGSPHKIETPGRPGWHLECSAMSEVLLGKTFDIHGGGIDLVFPHHENEIAQSRCAFHTSLMAKYWMHNGFLNVEGEKMSKSLGNFVTIRELLTTDKFGGRSWSGAVLRLAMLMTPYRHPIDWTLDRLQEAYSKRTRWLGPVPRRGIPEKGQLSSEFVNTLKDDLDLHTAFLVLDDLASRSRSAGSPESRNAANDLAATMYWLGIADDDDFAEARAGSESLRNTIRAAMVGMDENVIREKIEARNAARKAKNFAESDRIRDELLAQGIVLKDGPDGTTWEVKR